MLITLLSNLCFSRCLGVATANGECTGVEDNQPSTNSYKGYSGNNYQYNMNNRINYQYDNNAQIRDQFNSNSGTNIDKKLGQYGGGVYDK